MAWTNSSGSGSGNPFRLYRDTERGILAGVCAGIADYLGVEPIVVRLVTVGGLIFFLFPTILAYIALGVLLKPKPPALFRNSAEERFWRGVSTAPGDTFQQLKRKFDELEGRLRHMEGQVASGDFDLHRKFRDLDR
jgi:phage shock protein C